MQKLTGRWVAIGGCFLTSSTCSKFLNFSQCNSEVISQKSVEKSSKYLVIKENKKSVHYRSYMSQRTTKSTIRLVWPAMTDQTAVQSVSSLIAHALINLQGIQRGTNKKPCHSGWQYRLIWVFAGLVGLIVGFVVYWLIFYHKINFRINILEQSTETKMTKFGFWLETVLHKFLHLA